MTSNIHKGNRTAISEIGSKDKVAFVPFVSVLMPVRNESAYIEQSLTAVLKQDYPSEKFEVIIADGMSTDNTKELINKVACKKEISVHVLNNPDLIVPAAMNLAIKKARGDIILRVDGHAIIGPQYLYQCIEYLRKSDADCVGGAVESVGRGIMGEAIALGMSSKFGMGGSVFRNSADKNRATLSETVPFGAYRRDVFKQIGLFNEDMVRHQDYEFCYRLRKNGGKIVLLPNLRVKYFVRSTFKSFCKQYWQYGTWKGRFVKKYPDALKFRHLVPPLFVFVLLLSGLLSFFYKYALLVFTTTIGAYFFYLMVALMSFLMRRKFKFIPILAALLPCMHICWGTGLWKGIFMRKLD